ncbi:MAG: haloacid dehalogenase [Chloroflexi bacterium CFX4]|nr:haloacid dehalogenase [Chloroflexi bacterium CFX4]MDL1921438.1 haloacid dehalogenase [Chloroflexi bacterium CFX3]
MDTLDSTAELIRAALEAKNRARDATLEEARLLTRLCGNAIRAMHRQDWQAAEALLAEARQTLQRMAARLENLPDLYHAGYFQDAAKEYGEAAATLALLRDMPLPTPADLGIEPATYLNSLAEAASELRRYILDILRHHHDDQAEALLQKMDDIYAVLTTFDFPDAVSGGLRHRVDNLRGVLERTRGDVTTSLRQHRLQQALERAEGNQA